MSRQGKWLLTSSCLLPAFPAPRLLAACGEEQPPQSGSAPQKTPRQKPYSSNLPLLARDPLLSSQIIGGLALMIPGEMAAAGSQLRSGLAEGRAGGREGWVVGTPLGSAPSLRACR